MLDDYSLRLLAEIGIDVYMPRSAPALAVAVNEAGTGDPEHGIAASPEARVEPRAEVVIVAPVGQRGKLLVGIEQSLRFAGMHVRVHGDEMPGQTHVMRAVVVLGESLVRSFGATLDAAQHAAIEWVVAAEPDAIPSSANARRALWGELKRVSRHLATQHPQAGGAP